MARVCAIVIGWRRLTAVLEIDAGGLCGVGSLWNQVVHYETKWHSGFMTKFPPKVGFSCIFIIFGNLINDRTTSPIVHEIGYCNCTVETLPMIGNFSSEQKLSNNDLNWLLLGNILNFGLKEMTMWK